MVLRRLLKGPRPPFNVLMVCSGNICRSPTAEAVLRTKLERAGLAAQVGVDSAGTHAMRRGTPADPRAVAQAAARGYSLKGLKARQIDDEDFDRFDMILGMDEGHLEWLRHAAPRERQHAVGLLLDHAPGPDGREVVDPYYLGITAFDEALDRIEPACDALVIRLRGLARG